MKAFVSIFPKWYRFHTIVTIPATFVLLFASILYLRGNLAGDDRLSVYLALIWVYLLAIALAFETKFDNRWMGTVFAEKESFGRFLISSENGLKVLRSAYLFDLIAKVICCVVIFMLPGYLLYGWSTIFTGIYTCGVFIAASYIGRHTKSYMLMMLLLTMSVIVLIFGVMALPSWAGGAFGAVLAVVFGTLTMRAVKKSWEESYYDR